MNTNNKRLHGKTLQSSAYQELHRNPKFGQELGVEIKSEQLYQLVDQLDVTPTRGSPVRYETEPIENPTLYYLWGDERRAVRRIVQTYPLYIKECMENRKNPLKKAWEDFMFELLCEEWQYEDYTSQNDD